MKREELDIAIDNFHKSIEQFRIAVNLAFPKSILSGKCAIQVNNQREFELLREHYESKVWAIYNYGSYPQVKFYDNSGNGFSGTSAKIPHIFINLDTLGINLVPFADFAKEIGIDVPKYIKCALFAGMEAHVYSGEILIKDADKTVTTLRPSDLEDLLHTYKSLTEAI